MWGLSRRAGIGLLGRSICGRVVPLAPPAHALEISYLLRKNKRVYARSGKRANQSPRINRGSAGKSDPLRRLCG